MTLKLYLLSLDIIIETAVIGIVNTLSLVPWSYCVTVECQNAVICVRAVSTLCPAELENRYYVIVTSP